MPNSSPVTGSFAEKAIVAAVMLCLAAQAVLALVMEINWDEFFYLAHIYSYHNGELGAAIQTFHVHLFGWLTSVPGNEIDQVIAGRIVMLLCEGGTCALIYCLSRRFSSSPAALIAVLVFVSAAFTIIDGASFRADPIATLLLMAALVVLAGARPSLLSMAGAAVLAGVGAMITVKVALYAPAFAGVAVSRVMAAPDHRRMLLWLGGTAAATVGAFATLYLIQLNVIPSATNASSSASLGNAVAMQFGAGFAPRLSEMCQFALMSPLQVLLLVVGAAAAVATLQRRQDRPEAVAALGCGATLLCLLFYRNAFPYFFPFILAPAAIVAAIAVERIRLLSRHVLLLAFGLVAPAILVAIVWSGHDQAAQRQLLAAVHRIFPRPVAYIDRNSMIASFPKRGFFMSSWGMANYRQHGPVFDQVLASGTVPLLIVNGPALEQATGMISGLPERLQLFPEDAAVLRQNFIPHWGRIWVAGKRVVASPVGTGVSIAVPGIYTVEGGSVLIDGRTLPLGATVNLGRGPHVIRAATPAAVTLRWGDHLYRPDDPPIAAPIYRGF